MASVVIPVLRYADAERAMAWLCDAFGFEIFLKVPGEGGRIEHARLTMGDAMIMLASGGRGASFEREFLSPADIGGVTQSTLMTVDDPDRIFGTAQAAGARIIDHIQDFEFGGRTFSCADIESHVWVFSSHDPWRKLW